MGWFDDFIAAEKNPVRLMWGALPPNVRDQYSSGVRSLATVAGELSPGASVRDAVDASGEIAQGAVNLDWSKLGTGAANMGLAALGVIPGGRVLGKAIRGYHGSPHDFDKFDLSKIGTGEGAQAFGHGAYIAGSEGVARWYRDALSNSAIDVGGKKIRGIPGSPEDIALAWLENSKNAQSSDIYGWARENLKKTMDNSATNAITREKMTGALGVLEKWQIAGGKPTSAGHMYEVDIHADPARFLNWDKPLSAQTPEVQKALSTFGIQADKQGTAAFDDALVAALHGTGPPTLPKQPPNPMGANIYESSKIVPGGYRDPAAASTALKEAGIVGNRYLDQGSRSAGQGSSNYVVFDDKLIEILRKYGMLPLGAGAVGAAALAQPPEPQGGLF